MPGLLDPDALPGEGNLYPLLAARASLFGVSGAVLATRFELAAGAIATLYVAWRWCRQRLDAYGSAVATAAFSCGPGVLAAYQSGDPDAAMGWALLALPLVQGPGAVVLGAAIGLAAPTLALSAGLPVLLSPTRWRFAGWVVAVLVARVLPESGAIASPAWLAVLALGSAGRGRSVAAAGIAAFALSFAETHTAWLVPLLSMVSLSATFPRPDLAVLAGTLVLASGWVRLPTSDLTIPEPVTHVGQGTVLDLPTTRSANRRAAWLGAVHRQPRAANTDGLVVPDVQQSVDALLGGDCRDLGTHGIRWVLARREESLRDLAPLVTCLGPPVADDGKVAVWEVGGG